MTTDPNARLRELGNALHEATRAHLERTAPDRRRRRMLAGLGVAAVLIPAGAFAAGELLSTDEVADSLPAGTLAFAGTNPTCEVVVEQVEYHCVLDKPPGPLGAPENDTPTKYSVDRDRDGLKGVTIWEAGERPKDAGPPVGQAAPQTENWLNAAMSTIDSANRVNGGCRGLDREGITWQCYIGEAAVEQEIISRGFLGERARGPGIG